MPDVSVVIPSYNHAKFVAATLRSVFAQTLRPAKLIVIDDGSKDNSAAVIERVLKDSPIDAELIVRKNRGLSATLNEGIARTDSEYFAYIGSDDIWLPTFLEEQTALLGQRRNAALAFCHAHVIDESNRIIDCTSNWCDFPDGNLLPTLLSGEVFASPGVMYRRSMLPDKPWNEGAKLEDYELYLKLASRAEFARSRNILCAWRQHSFNTSGNFPLMLSEQITAQNRVMDAMNLSREELDEVQKRLRFRSVAICVRSGFRRDALKLFLENIGGAESAGDAIGKAARLMIPRPIFEWNRQRKLAANIARYGRLELDAPAQSH